MPERDAPANPPATHVCPYCGRVSATAPPAPCPACKMRDTPETRAATVARVGPWYLLQARNPAAPGMNFATLMSLVRRGHVTPTSVVRGPTTQQLWTQAGRVKGLSREFGVCYACGRELDRSSNLCPHCQRLQDPPINPDTLIEQKPPIAPAAPPAARPRRPAPTAAPAAAAPDLGLPAGSLPSLQAGETQERILTPRELAAAFAIAPPGAAPPAQAPTPAPRRRHPARTVLLTAVLFAAGALAAYAGIDPEFRAQARQSVTRATDWARAHLSESPAPPPARPVPAAAPVEKRAPVQSPPPEERSMAPAAPAKATPAASHIAPPLPVAPAKVLVDIGPPAGPAAAPADRPTPPVAEPAVPKSKEPAKPTEAEVRRSIDLFRQALEAESTNDYATAVKLYEQIQQLPQATWPATLDQRLAAAKLRAGNG